MPPTDSLRKLRKAFRLVRTPRYVRALRHGVAAAIEHAALLRSLECATVLDVGANLGQFSLAVRASLPHARVVAFEPLPGPARVFRTVFAGDPRVTLHQVALGEVCTHAEMHVTAKNDSSSLLPIASAQRQLYGTTEKARMTVRVAPLGEVITPADLVGRVLLKLDVQGFELTALRGCGELLSRVACVYVEGSFVELYEGQPLADDIVKYLAERGFALQGVYNVSYREGRAIQADFFFGRR